MARSDLQFGGQGGHCLFCNLDTRMHIFSMDFKDAPLSNLLPRAGIGLIGGDTCDYDADCNAVTQVLKATPDPCGVSCTAAECCVSRALG